MKEITVIKIGGTVLQTDCASLWSGVRALKESHHVVVVHGGGPQSTMLAQRLGHEPKIVHGRRITTELDLDAMKMAIGGSVNTDLTASAVTIGLPAIGISGVAGGLVQVNKRPPWIMDGNSIDFGFVGDIDRIDAVILENLLAFDLVPIVATMGIDGDGIVYNVNADTVAAEIAAAFPAEQLVLVTESGGIRDADGNSVSVLSRQEVRSGIEKGWITDGMIVKVHTALRALRAGVAEVRITSPEGIADTSRGTRITEDVYA